ncbi:MAG: putative O-glycosylation ligase, exosortase A system-associated [Methylovulum sp.]|uniref:putative O-glycosylation ligase, exosortase A system-associated n=1 Tax=Methylovulum sp. TaxID=1916980 RepID=UPI0026098DC2|nr:putative O-glycosylation ligase, exosortase A system-associated [Methylovulum sp.]MDD2725358.1 putative O-glycosylation ligase, exosortase A system-associated [Methylovulum sp.]MDD5124453.1 putative O-glycosylation ligase, exosortase A system-associated [Methylovulum sp.]
MRDLFITFVVLAGCVYTLKKPYIGILLWSWLSYMNPHRLAYGFAYNMPFAQITALTLLVSMVLSKDTRKLPVNGLTTIWIVFVLFMGLTTVFAYFPDAAQTQYLRIVKIQFIVFLTMMLMTDLEKIRQLIWVIVLSLGYFSVKGGLFTLLTGGSYRVWGPESSFIEDNNSLAVAVLMTIPLMIYLYQSSRKSLIKKGLLVAIVLSLFTVLGSQSRGALLAIATVVAFFWLKTDKKMVSGILILIISGTMLLFLPESWFQRMDTIQTYDQDASAMGRINAWEYAFNAANHQLLGMGLDSWSLETFYLYAPNPKDVHAAHSIYFSVLADHGWIGLILFLSIFFMTWRKLSKIIKATSKDDNLSEINSMAKMIQVSLLAYFSGGAFLSLSYFDLPWHLASLVVLLETTVTQQTPPNPLPKTVPTPN